MPATCTSTSTVRSGSLLLLLLLQVLVRVLVQVCHLSDASMMDLILWNILWIGKAYMPSSLQQGPEAVSPRRGAPGPGGLVPGHVHIHLMDRPLPDLHPSGWMMGLLDRCVKIYYIIPYGSSSPTLVVVK